MPTTLVLPVDARHPDAATIERAAACLRGGGLVAFPTETVYGLGAHALDAVAVARIFEAKDRPAHDPLIVHIAAFDQIHALSSRLPDHARVLASRFWPGPLTLVVPRSQAVPPEVSAGLDTVAVRVPAHPVAQALLVAAGLPVAAPSANLFSRPSPTRASHVRDDLDGRIDLILDGGATEVGLESTVLDLSSGVPTVLRPGAVSLDALRAVLGEVHLYDASHALADASALPSPGLLSKHYAPRAPLTLYEGNLDRVWARLQADAAAARAAGRTVAIIDYGLQDPGVVATRLFATLRDIDATGVDQILVRGMAETEGLGLAVRDRLRRAAAGRVIVE